ncbi:MAG TPA: GGDEF domain-containing protein, partial [Phycisphaerae bacterium]|nr:GGDEF domain-containing protein [Phycisphaerae bacterium]
MTSFRKAISLCCACFILATTASILWQMSWRASNASAADVNPIAPLGLSVETWVWVWIPLIAAILVFAVVLSIVLRLRMRSDLGRLRSAIRQLATPEKEGSQRAFALEELCDCAAELSDVAATLRSERARLSEDASRDALTGLLNRRPFIDTLTREAAFANRTDWPLSLVMLDLDHFKLLNDTYGHNAGDVALRRTADRLASLVRQSDSVARFGGEEFAIILPGTRLSQAMKIARQLRDALRCDQFIYEDHTIRVTASFGVAELHECGVADAEALISQSDLAMYEAKRLGRDMVVAAHAVRSDPPAAQAAEPQDQRPTEAAADPNEAEGAPMDRDTLALMGSTFSVLQVIPDKHRVAHDTVQQVATVLQARTVGLFMRGPKGDELLPM